jgi:hypothetical protein
MCEDKNLCQKVYTHQIFNCDVETKTILPFSNVYKIAWLIKIAFFQRIQASSAPCFKGTKMNASARREPLQPVLPLS